MLLLKALSVKQTKIPPLFVALSPIPVHGVWIKFHPQYLCIIHPSIHPTNKQSKQRGKKGTHLSFPSDDENGDEDENQDCGRLPHGRLGKKRSTAALFIPSGCSSAEKEKGSKSNTGHQLLNHAIASEQRVNS